MRPLFFRPPCVTHHINLSKAFSIPTRNRVHSDVRSFTQTSFVRRAKLNIQEQDEITKVPGLTTIKGEPFSRPALESVLRRRMFYMPSFEIYQGETGVETRGLYDYGPPGCALQTNIIDQFRKQFILAEDMLEIDCTCLTPSEVLKTSGHAAKFSDWMCKDMMTGEILRVDHVVKEVLEERLRLHEEAVYEGIEKTMVPNRFKVNVRNKPAASRARIRKGKQPVKLRDTTIKEYQDILAKLDDYTGPELGTLLVKHRIKNPTTQCDLSAPVPFNLMFTTNLGPLTISGNQPTNAYLRPETAQGQFVNFHKLLSFNQQIMPFASASIGKAFRNEISPRSGLLRVREFLMAEIEHYVDPARGKRHTRFNEVSDVTLPLLSREEQAAGSTKTTPMTIGAAVNAGLVANETLGYFLARIQLFLLSLGIDPHKIRFRQHMSNEMAHYATDCWDAELLTSYGWIETVGCADRAAYDLTAHGLRTHAPLQARAILDNPEHIDEWTVEIEPKTFGPKFRRDAQRIEHTLRALSQEQLEERAAVLDSQGYMTLQVPGISGNAYINTNLHVNTVTLDSTLLSIVRRTRTITSRDYIPAVIEPSFGIGRILYAVLEHAFWTRPDDAARGVLSLPLSVAPTKVLIVPLSNNPAFTPTITRLRTQLRALGIAARVDSGNASLGKRYARSDELGTPLGVTVDFQSARDGSVTLRERDSTAQVRGSVEEVLEAVRAMVDGRESVESVFARLPRFEGQEVDEQVDGVGEGNENVGGKDEVDEVEQK